MSNHVQGIVSVKYSCGFSNPQISPIIAADRYLDYFITIMKDRLWQVLAKSVLRWQNRSGLNVQRLLRYGSRDKMLCVQLMESGIYTVYHTRALVLLESIVAYFLTGVWTNWNETGSLF